MSVDSRPARSAASVDIAAFLGMFATFCSVFIAVVTSLVPLVVCLALGGICLLQKPTRPVGAWMTTGALLGAAAVTVLVVLLAASGPIFGEG